ncbi:MAG: type II secretion system protein [bacterium]
MLKEKTVKGFNLIETLVYVAILFIVLGGLFSFVSWSMRTSAKAKTMREVLNSTKQAMEVILYETREAEAVYEPTTTSSQLSLRTAKYLPIGESDSYIDFFLCEGRLCIRKEGRTPVVLTPENINIANLNFTKIKTGDNYSIQVDIQAEYRNPGGRLEYQSAVNLSSSASLRAY